MRLRNMLAKFIEYAFYVLFFITPLLFNPSRTFPSFELFEFPKMMFVYAITTIIACAWVSLMIVEKKIRWQKTPFDVPLLLYLGSAALSTLFSIDQHVSFFGYYSRFHGGLLSTICYIFLFYAFVANREFIQLKLLILYAFGSGLIVVFYGIAERFGIDAHMWVQDVRSRVFSTLGQPNWLAAFLAILLPVVIATQISNFKNDLTKINIKSKGLKELGWLIISLIFYACLLFTKSRSGFLAFWIAYGLFWTGQLYSSSERIESKRFLRNISSRLRSNNILKLFLFLTLSYLTLNFFIKTPFPQYNQYATIQILNHEQVVPETPPVGDSVINVGITDSADIRRIVWKGALDIARTYPLFGTGPETFAYSYYKFRPQVHNLTSEWDFLYNRAHNEFLNYAATQGFLGLGLYLLLILVVYVWTLIQALKQTKGIQVSLIALLAAYTSIHITNFFGFSVVVIGLYFYLIPAFVFTLTKPKKEAQTNPVTLNTKQIAGLGLVGFVSLFVLYSLSKFWLADSLYAQAQRFSRQDAHNEAYPLITNATKLRTGEPVYHDEKATIASNLALQAFSIRDATQTAEMMREAIDESSKALTISPQNVNFWKSRTRIFFAFAEIDPSFYDQALSTIQIARELAPTDAKIAYNMAVSFGRLNRNQEAIETLRKTIDLKPDYRDPYVALAIFYEEEKQIDAAREILTLALERINPNDKEIKQRLVDLK